MAEENKYSHTDIDRYLQQKMTLKEMHAFERMMMDDPFLADAIEGFAKADNEVSEKHLLQIKKIIQGEKEDALVVPMATGRSTIWKNAAAAVIALVIVGAAFLFFSKETQNSQTKALAQQNTSTTQKISDTTPNPLDESIVIKQEQAAKPYKLPSNYKTTDNANLQKTSRTNSIVLSDNLIASNSAATEDVVRKDEKVSDELLAGKKLEERTTQEDLKKAAQTRQSTEAKAKEVSSSLSLMKEARPGNQLENVSRRNINEREFKGRVIDNRGEPLPFASIRSHNNAIEAMADSKGNFVLNAPDTVLNVTVNSVGHEVARAQLKSSATNNNVVLNVSKSKLEEVVVIGYGAAKRRQITGAISTLKVDTVAQPKGGWDKFNQYIKTEIDRFKNKPNAGAENLNEYIYLEFNINKQGLPINITVAPKTRNQIAEKVVEVLKKGPRWQRLTKNEKVKLKILF